jgi:predicted N-acetyltransferase YhbS
MIPGRGAMATADDMRLHHFRSSFPTIFSMTAHDVTYAQEMPAHDAEIDHISAEAFGPGRFARAAFRIREGGPHDRSLSFVALDGGSVIGSVRLTPVVVGIFPALLLGPLAVRPSWKKKGVGKALMRMAIEAARADGHGLVVLVGDEPYYGPFGFRRTPHGQIRMPAPVDPDRLLACELIPHSLEKAHGMVRHRVLAKV